MKNKWIILALVTVIGVALDTATKMMAASMLEPGRHVEVLGQLFGFILVFNKAAVWGFDPRHWLPWFPLNTFFAVFSAIAIAVLVIYFAMVKKSDKLLVWGLALIMPGAFGNLIDRILYAKRGVVDFIRLGLSENVYWAIFNFADMYITFGVAVILLSMILEGRRRRKK